MTTYADHMVATVDVRHETLRRLKAGTGKLATAALRELDADYRWFGELPAQERSWVGTVAQAGITSFVSWYANPSATYRGALEIFAAAPPELTRSVSLQHTLSIVRTVVKVVEDNADELAAVGGEAHLREAILRYSREVAFSAAEVYARAAETRGAWDARLEALVVDALVRGEVDDDLPSRAAALGWKPGPTLVVVGRTDGPLGENQSAELRRAMRRAATGAMVGIHGEDLIVIARSDQDLRELAANIMESFGPGPVVIGPPAVTLLEVARSTRAAFAGVVAAPAWSLSPRPVLADDLLPEHKIGCHHHQRDVELGKSLHISMHRKEFMNPSGPVQQTGTGKNDIKIRKDIFAIHLEQEFLETVDAATCIKCADIGTHTATGNKINWDLRLLERFNNTDMRPAARGSTAKHQSDCFTR